MAVLIEATSVVIRVDSLHKSFPGGWQSFKSMVPNRTLCADGEIARVGFMDPEDVGSFTKKLEKNGLTFLFEDKSVDIAVVDQLKGPTVKCDWLECGHVDLTSDGHRVTACRLVRSEKTEIVTPLGWTYEKSLSSSYGFIPTGHKDKTLKYLRNENGLEVYFNTLTGKVTYIGRTSKS